MCGRLTLTIVLSRISMNAASVTTTAISHGLLRGFQPASPEASATQHLLPGPCGAVPRAIRRTPQAAGGAALACNAASTAPPFGDPRPVTGSQPGPAE